MRKLGNPWLVGSVLAAGVIAFVSGCTNTPVDTSSRTQGPAPLRMPAPDAEGDGAKSYEDSLTGGKVFAMYCNYCHNAPSFAERSYSQFQNVPAHMRVRANLTGKEYTKLMEFVRRWHDVPPPNPPLEPAPTRVIFSQPINELRELPPANVDQPKKDMP